MCGDISRMRFKRHVLRHVGGRGGIVKEDTWWWNEGVKEAISGKEDAHKTMCRNTTEENKNGYKSIKIKQRKRFQKQ